MFSFNDDDFFFVILSRASSFCGNLMTVSVWTVFSDHELNRETEIHVARILEILES